MKVPPPGRGEARRRDQHGGRRQPRARPAAWRNRRPAHPRLADPSRPGSGTGGEQPPASPPAGQCQPSPRTVRPPECPAQSGMRPGASPSWTVTPGRRNAHPYPGNLPQDPASPVLLTLSAPPRRTPPDRWSSRIPAPSNRVTVAAGNQLQQCRSDIREPPPGESVRTVVQPLRPMRTKVVQKPLRRLLWSGIVRRAADQRHGHHRRQAPVTGPVPGRVSGPGARARTIGEDA